MRLIFGALVLTGVMYVTDEAHKGEKTIDNPSRRSFFPPELTHIPVSERMIEVGLGAFAAYDSRFDFEEEAVIAIYRRMENARRLSQEEKSRGQTPER